MQTQSHTYEYWSSMGYIIKRGSKSESKDAQGKPLFARRQVLAYNEQKANYFYR